jgi:hypothetical protein
MHNRKARAIDNGEILVPPRDPNLPCSLQVGQANRLNDRNAAVQTLPETASGIWA